MPEFTQEELKKLSDVVDVIKAHPDCKDDLMKLLEPKDGTYKPWEPEIGEQYFRVDSTGYIADKCNNYLHGELSPETTKFFNRFRNEETARRAAATDRINHLYFQWCEAHNHDPSKDKSPFKNVDFSQNGEWIIESWGSFIPQFHFKNIEMANQFLKECRPYLDEYAKEMGWLDA